jgi:hypothetical protein
MVAIPGPHVRCTTDIWTWRSCRGASEKGRNGVRGPFVTWPSDPLPGPIRGSTNRSTESEYCGGKSDVIVTPTGPEFVIVNPKCTGCPAWHSTPHSWNDDPSGEVWLPRSCAKGAGENETKAAETGS